jgi:REP element-mobilizing transposase RayT
MSNTYSQIYLQFVFAVKHRQALITPDIRVPIEKYMCSVASKNMCKPLSIYCNPDHTHLFVNMKPGISCSTVVQKIKSTSSHFINESQLIKSHFEWQSGYGAFSYGKSQVNDVCKYIANQHKHHNKIAFREEYVDLLKAFCVDYDDTYLFDWLL